MPEFNLTLDQLVEQSLPTGFSVSAQFKNRSLMKWQLLLGEGLGITPSSWYTLTAYSPLAILLFSNLVIYDALVVASRASFILTLGSSGVGETASAVEANPKRITTGPTEVEFHSSGDELSKLLKSGTSESLIGMFMGEACMVANKLGIKLPFCKQLNPHICLKKATRGTYLTIEQIMARNGIINNGN